MPNLPTPFPRDFGGSALLPPKFSPVCPNPPYPKTPPSRTLEPGPISCHDGPVPVTVYLRDLDDDVYQRLEQLARKAGLSVEALLKARIEQLANRPVAERLARAHDPIA